jgi:hypothetical protein
MSETDATDFDCVDGAVSQQQRPAEHRNNLHGTPPLHHLSPRPGPQARESPPGQTLSAASDRRPPTPAVWAGFPAIAARNQRRKPRRAQRVRSKGSPPTSHLRRCGALPGAEWTAPCQPTR